MRVELSGAETCEVVSNGGFISVKVPLRITGGAARLNAVLRYQMGAFIGREVMRSLRGDSESKIVYRVPQEVFGESAPLRLQILNRDEAEETVLWAKTYVGHWTDGAPWLEAVAVNE